MGNNAPQEERSLIDRSLTGMLWVSLDKLGGSGINFLITILLARLLFPADFGIVAMAMVFFELSSVFVESGFSTALIREREISALDKSTTFLFNLVTSVVLYVALFLCAPLIASFFEEPVLTAIVRVMGLNLIVEALAIVQTSSLSQQVDFKTQAKARFVAIVLSGVVGVTMAYQGYGVWALVARILVGAAIHTALLWKFSPWVPIMAFSKASFNKLFGFGSKILLAALLDKLFSQAYKLVIGKFFAAATLGFYAQAAVFVNMVINTLFRTIQTVSYPVLSKLQDDKPRLKGGYRMILKLSSFVIFPVLVLLGVLALPIIEALIGAKWAPAAPYLQLLCIAGATHHMTSVNLNVLLVLGRSDLSLKLEVIKKVNIAIAIVIGLRYGMMGLVVGEVIVTYVNMLINVFYAKMLLRYTLLEQLRDILPTLMMSLLVGIAVHFLYGAMHGLGHWNLVVTVAVGGAAYLLLHRLVRSEEWRMVVEVVIPRSLKLIRARK